MSIKQTKAYKQLHDALMENLQARGLVEEIYTDKVKEYMDLWERRQELKADIEKRGIAVEDIRQGRLVENRSVSLEMQVSRQMLSLFKSLGFEAQALERDGEDPDDEL